MEKTSNEVQKDKMGTILTPRLIKRTRRAIERLYTGTCTIEVKPRLQKDPITKKTAVSDTVVIYKDIPCQLSHLSQTASESRILPQADGQIMLFLAPEIDVPEGSRITVEQAGITDVYGHSGRPNMFPTHQEITLTIWEGWNGQKRN